MGRSQSRARSRAVSVWWSLPLGRSSPPEGETLLAAPEGSAKLSQHSALRQGVIETSNVNSINSVVTLIGVQRQAEMLQRAMTLFDNEFNRIASTDLAKV